MVKQKVRNPSNLNHLSQNWEREKNKLLLLFSSSHCFGASLPKKTVAPGEGVGKKQNVSVWQVLSAALARLTRKR